LNRLQASVPGPWDGTAWKKKRGCNSTTGLESLHTYPKEKKGRLGINFGLKSAAENPKNFSAAALRAHE
jgi:hypothetical protein